VKYPVFIFINLFSLATVFGQTSNQKWFLGSYSVDPFNPKIGIHFTPSSADTFQMIRSMGFNLTSAQVFDANGEVLFYTNGVYVAKKDHDTLLNSENFNPGWGTEYYSPAGLGYSQGSIILPKPGIDSFYYIFHVTGEPIVVNGQFDVQPLNFRVSEVDLRLDNGLGAIVEGKKNIHLIEDTVSQGRITACRHANGRDWWVITHKFHSDIYYIVHVNPDTFIVKEQNIGKVLYSNDIYGMGVFSPDGTWYAQVNANDTLDLFNFDRCTGELNNPIELTVPVGPYGTVGCSFSPSNRFMYINDLTNIYQFDLTAGNIQESIVKVAEWDSTYIPFATWFFIPQLAPDGKIYVSTYNGSHRLHVINKPDSLGVGCNVSLHSFILPESAVQNITLPNLPNYGLGELPNSPCDTLALAIEEIPTDYFSFYPNPSGSNFVINYKISSEAVLRLINLQGIVTNEWELPPNLTSRSINIQDVSAGIYFLSMVTQNGVQLTKKIIVQN
jgi:hypothetical protein